MQKTLFTISTGMICAGMMNAALAGYGSSVSSTQSGSGYQSSYSSSSMSGYQSSMGSQTTTSSEQTHKKHNHFSLSVTLPGSNSIITYNNGRFKHQTYAHQNIGWVRMESGEPIPVNTVIGGNQYDPNAMLYVCRANYRGGVHPGKYFQGNCNISFGGREIVMQHFEVLVSRLPLNWVHASFGDVPAGAIEGGYENGRPLYICQTYYMNGTHTGKIVGDRCDFGWGGKEVYSASYNVLVV